jgi:hypothetical protein
MKEKDKERERNKEKDRERGRERERQKERKTQREREIEVGKKVWSNGHKDRQCVQRRTILTNRQTEKKVEQSLFSR